MDLIEKTLESELIYKGAIINLKKDKVLLPNGHKSYREVVEHKGGVCVLALTEKNEVLLVKQYRYPFKEILLEIPAGKRDTLDEHPLECGKRELMEETGAEAKKFTSLGLMYPTPGFAGEIIYMFLATDVSFGKARPDEDEFVEVIKMPFDKVLQMVLDGEIKDAKTQCAVMKAALVIQKNKK